MDMLRDIADQATRSVENAFLAREGDHQFGRLEDHFLENDISPMEGSPEAAFLDREDSGAAWARRWVQGDDVQLPEGRALNLRDLRDRVPTDPEQLGELARHYEATDDSFQNRVESLRGKLNAARAAHDPMAEQDVKSQAG